MTRATSRKNVVVLGGYGNFGKRIVESLCCLPNTVVHVAGRSLDKAQKFCIQVGGGKAMPLQLDIDAPDLTARLQSVPAFLVIHTSGPFQGQDYRVPEACLRVGSHYVDLADDRRFVCDIHRLHERAQERGLVFVSGASSVPGLSSSVVDHFQPEFSDLHEIDLAIAPGNQAERGLATVKAILCYTGRPFASFTNGRWQDIYGWMSPRRRDFGPTVGRRWLANVDVPDLALFPQRYQGVRTVRFQAGLELPWLHLTLVAMAWLAKVRLVNNWAPLAKLAFALSEQLKNLGSDVGGMQVSLRGLDHSAQPLTLHWTLTAPNGVGPYIPTVPAVILAKKLLAGELTVRGAMACQGLFTVREFMREVAGLGISCRLERANG